MVRHKRIFSIPPGAPFLKTLAAALLDGRLNDTFRYDPDDALSLSTVTIFVPTRRSARVLRSEFVELLGGRSAILPVIRPLGETDDDSGYFDLVAPEEMDLALPIGGTSRLLELGRLILAWRNQLPKVVLDIHTESPLVAPASPADAVWLARALAELIDSIETEERDWSDLDNLQTGEHALWWQLTAEFLKSPAPSGRHDWKSCAALPLPVIGQRSCAARCGGSWPRIIAARLSLPAPPVRCRRLPI